MSVPRVGDDLGANGKAWVKQSLAAGRRLSKAFLTTAGIESGKTFALGLAVPSRTVARFQLDEGVADRSVLSLSSSADALLSLIRELERRYGSMTFVVEDDLRQPTDPTVMANVHGWCRVIDDEVYACRPTADLLSSAEVVRYVGGSASGYPLNGFLLAHTTCDEFSELLSAGRLIAIVRSAVAIVNAVFDSDGYSVWIPDSVFAYVT